LGALNDILIVGLTSISDLRCRKYCLSRLVKSVQYRVAKINFFHYYELQCNVFNLVALQLQNY
jgi:hypothetical protein